MTDDYLEFSYYEELTKFYRGKRAPIWMELPQDLLNKPWFLNLSMSERGILMSLMLLSLRYCNRIPVDDCIIRTALNADRNRSLRTTINKFIDLQIFMCRKCALPNRTGKVKEETKILEPPRKTKLSEKDVRSQLDAINKKYLTPLATALPMGALAAQDGENEKR